jgi:nicotinate phosphoribosyltransferase
MHDLSRLYRHSLALLTDLYQLTMAYGYWKLGMAEREAVFHLTFRRCPFGGEFAVACGLAYVVDYLSELRFTQDDRDYLASIAGADGRPLFDRGFLEFLGRFEFACDVHAVPEGAAVFAHEPLVRVQGPLWQAQVLETALLNIVNFQTLIATKAARVARAAAGQSVLEFGLRRAQGVDGGISASRAAYVGGCSATSNVLAGKLFGIPVKGTHAHSWVMAFDDERQAFQAYADAMPNNCVFLVDTYDTLRGVHNAAEVGRKLRESGHEMLGVRLDSGDLGELGPAARRILDEAGFPEAAVVASNELDEHQIAALRAADSQISVWGVGTRLATAYDQPALGGIYKLGALRDGGGQWRYKMKLSEQPIKVSQPGIQQVRRYRLGDRCIGDVIHDEGAAPAAPYRSGEAVDFSGRPLFRAPSGVAANDLLVAVFRQGGRIYDPPDVHEARRRTLEDLDRLDPAVTRLSSPIAYPVGLSPELYALKSELMASAREQEAQGR